LKKVKLPRLKQKLKKLRPFAERIISQAKRGDLASRRRVLAVIRNKSVVHSLFTEIGPSFAKRNGGYLRITKLGPRKGDNAPMAVIELVEALAEKVVAEAEGATKKAAKEQAAPVAETKAKTAKKTEKKEESKEA